MNGRPLFSFFIERAVNKIGGNKSLYLAITMKDAVVFF